MAWVPDHVSRTMGAEVSSSADEASKGGPEAAPVRRGVARDPTKAKFRRPVNVQPRAAPRRTRRPMPRRPRAAPAAAPSPPPPRSDAELSAEPGGFTTDPGVETESVGVSSLKGSTLLHSSAMAILARSGQLRNFSTDAQAATRLGLRLDATGVAPTAKRLIMANAVVIKASDAETEETDARMAECLARRHASPYVECVELKTAFSGGDNGANLVYMEGIVTSSECPEEVYFLPWVYDIRSGRVLDCARLRGVNTPRAHTLTYTGVPVWLTTDMAASPVFAAKGALACVGCAA